MSRKEEDFEQLETTIANYTIALEKRLNEIRRLEGVNTALLAALEGLVADDVSYNCAHCGRNASDHDPHRASCPVMLARAAIEAAK